MEKREYDNNITKFLGITYHTFADPVNEGITKLRDSEYRTRALGKALDIVYLTIAIATPILTINELNKISRYAKDNITINQSTNKR